MHQHKNPRLKKRKKSQRSNVNIAIIKNILPYNTKPKFKNEKNGIFQKSISNIPNKAKTPPKICQHKKFVFLNS